MVTDTNAPSRAVRYAGAVDELLPLLAKHGLTLEQLVGAGAQAIPVLERHGIRIGARPRPPVPFPELPEVLPGVPDGLEVVDDPIPAPDSPEVPLWRPTRAEVRAWRSALALDRELFSLFFLSWPEAKQDRYIAMCHERGLTHVVILFSGGYRDRFPSFNLWGDVPAIRRGLERLLRARLIPVLCASNQELAGRGGMDVARAIVRTWAGTLPHVADLLPAATPGVEFNDYLTPEAQHEITVALAAFLPDAYRLVWFTDDRCHGDHNRGSGPDGQPPAAWHPEPDPNNPGKLRASVLGYWPATPADGLFYQSGKWRDLPAFVDDLGDVSVRVNGRLEVPGKSALYPGMGRDVVFGEGPAEQILDGSTTYADTEPVRAAARRVPGITGTGD